jgi:hypothetical protein
MPANIAHLLICNKSVKALEDGGGYEEFIRVLDSDERAWGQIFILDFNKKRESSIKSWPNPLRRRNGEMRG